jgi:cytochrome c553
MMRSTRPLTVFLAAALSLVAACAVLQPAVEMPATHPEEVGPAAPMCTECHEPDGGSVAYARFDHTPMFATSGHRQPSVNQEVVCSLCHQTAFCNTCHITKDELKPSTKDPGGTYRAYPHRGDYRTRHRIDARVDPSSCFRCHGNPRSSKSCRPCHG